MANEQRLDLIDRQALGIGRCNPDAFPLQNRGYVAGWNGVINLLEQAPRIDAIVTPVNIGDVLWCNLPHSEHPLECRVYCICREERNGLVLDYFRCVVKGWFSKAFGFEDVGKTVFFTKEEAWNRRAEDGK